MNIRKFSAEVSKRGVARPTHYYIEIVPPKIMRQTSGTAQDKTNRLAMLCERTQIPGRIINATKHMIYGVERDMPFGVQYQDLPCTFICTDDMEVRNFFDQWQSLIVNMEDNTFSYYDDYVTDIYIVKVNNQNVPTSVHWIKEAYPSTIAPQQLGYGEKDLFRLDVTFAFYNWFSLYDIRQNGYQDPPNIVPRVESEITGAILPPSNFSLNSVANQFLQVAGPVSISFQEAKRIAEDYSRFLRDILGKFGI